MLSGMLHTIRMIPSISDLHRVRYASLSLSLCTQAGQFVQMYVTSTDRYGKVYAQLNSVARTCLQNRMNNEIMSQIPANVLTSSAVRAIDFTKMYLVRLESQWYRARVTDVQNDRLVTVFLLDVGRTVTALRSNLLHMDKILKALQSIPPQVSGRYCAVGSECLTFHDDGIDETDSRVYLYARRRHRSSCIISTNRCTARGSW